MFSIAFWMTVVVLAAFAFFVRKRIWYWARVAYAVAKDRIRRTPIVARARPLAQPVVTAVRARAAGNSSIISIGVAFAFLMLLLFLWLSWTAVGIIVGLTVAVLLIAFLVFIDWETINEGHAVEFTFLGSSCYLGVELKGHHLDNNNFVVLGPGPKGIGNCIFLLRIGGTVFYIKWLVRPVVFEEFNEKGVSLGKKTNVPLRDFNFGFALEAAETGPENPPQAGAQPGVPGKAENLRLDIDFLATTRIVNPYLFLHRAPKDANKQVAEKLEATTRGWVKIGGESHAQMAKGNGQKLWTELVDPAGLDNQPMFDSVKVDWGIEVIKDRVVVKDIRYDEETRKVLDLERRTTLEMDAKIKGAEMEAIVRKQAAIGSAQDLVGPVFSAMASLRNMTYEKFQEEVKNKPELREQLDKYTQDLFSELSQMRTGAVKKYEGLGDGGIVMALLARFLEGGTVKSDDKRNRNEMSKEEIRKRYEEMTGQ